MSGLLDKANKAAEDKEEAVVAVVEDRAPAGFAEANDSDNEVDKRVQIGYKLVVLSDS